MSAEPEWITLRALIVSFIFLLAYLTNIYYSLNMDIQNPHDKFFKAVFSEKEAAISYEGADRVMTISESLIEKGIEKGKLEGI